MDDSFVEMLVVLRKVILAATRRGAVSRTQQQHDDGRQTATARAVTRTRVEVSREVSGDSWNLRRNLTLTSIEPANSEKLH